MELVPGDLALVGEGGGVGERLERRNELARDTERGRRVLAANLDALAVVAAAGTLDGGEGLIARVIAAAHASGLSPLLVFTKADLDADGALAHRCERARALGFEAFLVSSQDGAGVEALEARLEGRAVAWVGASGVGKSTLINRLHPEAEQVTGALDPTGRGRHTTTLGRAIPWRGGHLVDLPGVRSFGLFDAEGLLEAFPDVAAPAQGCRFRDCAHQREPGCQVQVALEEGLLEEARLDAWRGILESLKAGQEGAGVRSGR